MQSLINNALKELKGKFTPEQLEALVAQLIEYFSNSTKPIFENEVRDVAIAEWKKLAPKRFTRLLGDSANEFINSASKNVYAEDAIQKFNLDLTNRLTTTVGDKDLTTERLVDDLRGILDESEGRLRTIARTESTKVANGARLLLYERIKEPEDKYSWDIISDARTTSVCKRIHDRAAKGVTKDELIQIMQEESSKDFPNWKVNTGQPAAHYNCRSLVKLVR